MSLTDHLRELRRRVVICAVAITAGGSVGWIYYNQILIKLQQPIFKVQRMRHTDMVALNFGGDGVTGAFSVKFKVALFVGLLIASPIWIYQLWAFIVPALKRREKLYTWAFWLPPSRCLRSAQGWPGSASPKRSRRCST